MTIVDSLFVAVIGMTIVFSVLILLSLLISLQAMFFKLIKYKKTAGNSVEEKETAYDLMEIDNGPCAGEAKIIGTDEETVIVIMSAVCYESGIPLSKLKFKSIRALD